MLVPTCLNIKLQEVFTINSMLLNVFSVPKVYLSKILTKDKKQGSFMLNKSKDAHTNCLDLLGLDLNGFFLVKMLLLIIMF